MQCLMMPIPQSAPGIRNSCIWRLRTCGEFSSFWNISNHHWKNNMVLPIDHQNGTSYLIYTLSTMFRVYSTVYKSKWHGSLFVSSSSKSKTCKLSTQLLCLIITISLLCCWRRFINFELECALDIPTLIE